MSISASLVNALSGIRVNNKLTETASNNLANVLTDGYGRQVANVSAVALNGAGVGVRITSINREMAPEYTQPRRQADADAGRGSAIADALSRIGVALGEADGDDGLFIRVQEFEAHLRALAETPEATPRQDATIDAAKDIASNLNKLSEMAAVIRQDADGAIDAQIDRVNSNLSRIADLNSNVQLLSATDSSFPALVDERERLIDEINAILPVRTQIQDDGTVHLYTAEGVFLLRETAKTIDFTHQDLITAPMVYAPGGAGALSGLTVDGEEITPGSGVRFAVQSGSLAGHFAIRDEAGTTFQERIDRFAVDLIARFEDPAVDPTLLAGDPGLFTDAGGVLDLTVIEGLAGRISVNALADPAQGGDAAALRDGLQAAVPGPSSSDTILRNLLDAARAKRTGTGVPGLTGAYSAAELASGLVEVTAIARTNAETDASRLNATRVTLGEAEAERIGVDQDAELASLIQIEQAYNANVQVIQTVSRMLQELSELR